MFHLCVLNLYFYLTFIPGSPHESHSCVSLSLLFQALTSLIYYSSSLQCVSLFYIMSL